MKGNIWKSGGNMEEKEEGGITIGDIFRVIFSQKWLVLILAAIITLVGTVGVYFLGESKSVYSATFVMQLPGSEESPTTYTFPDGTRFHFTDLISKSNLEDAKASSDVFKNIDVKKMREKGDVSISRELVETATGSDIYRVYYNLSIKTKYFNSKDSAREFIIKLIDMPERYFANLELSYDAYLTAASELLAYDKKISYLQNQASYIVSRYNSFISSYGEDTMANGKMLRSYSSAINVLFDNQVFEKLRAEARIKGYVISEDAAKNYYTESNLQNLKDQYEIEYNALENLLNVTQDSSSSTIVSGDIIVSQTRIVGELKQEIDYFNNFKPENVNEDFNKRVSQLEGQVRAFTEEFEVVAQAVYSMGITVNYENANIIEKDDDFGFIISLLIGLVAGVIVAMIVGYIVGYNKMKKATHAEPVRVYHEAQLQIAATNDSEHTDEKQE